MEQLIYTRSFPHVSLADGHIEYQEEFGFAAVSKNAVGMLPPDTMPLFERIIQTKSFVREGARAYEYVKLGNDLCFLIHEYARPLCLTPRKNGMAHRPGNFIKQCLAGKPGGYPAEWFGARNWDAWQKDENSYYLDDAPDSLDYLPQVSDTPSDCGLTRDPVYDFISRGREQALRAAVNFVIKELGKPAGDRRFVLIRDIPENAEKWIAAIGYAFSPEIAAEITFATNKTLADRSAKELLFLDDGSPLYMLTGCHPSDESWSYAQDRIKNRYALLDGEAKAFSAPDADIPKSAYYEDISGNSEEFRHFTETWLPAMGIKAVDAALIPGIYGCYKNLLDRSEYPTLKDSVKYLTEFLGSETAAADEIANIMFEKGIYASVAGKDKTNGFELLQLLLLKCQARESLITEQIADMVKGFLADNAAKYLQYMNAMNSRISWFPDKIAPLVFDSAVLWQYYPAVEKAGAGSALALLKRFDDWNKGNPEQMPEAKEFIYRCVKAVFSQDSEKEKADIITMFTNRDVLKAGVCERITADMDKTPGTLELAFRLPHNKPSDFCTLLGNCDIDLAESYLANRIGKETLEEKLFQYFVECKNCFGSGESTGTMFLTRWMESHNNYSEMIDLINGLSDTAKEKLFADLDKKLLGDQSDNSEELFIKLPQGSKCREIYDFKTEFCSGQLMKNSETGIYECVAQVPPLGLTADEIFINSKLFGNIIKKACKMKDPQMHLTLLKKFDIKAEALYSYIRVCLANDKNDPHIRETLVRTAGLAEGELKEDIQRQLEKCDAEDKPTSGVSNKRQDSQPSTGSQNGTLGNKIQSKGGSNFNPLLLSGFFIMAILVLFVVVVFLISQYFDVSWTIDIPPLLRWPCN